MPHPAREEKARAIAVAIGEYVAAYIARNIHMSAKNEVVDEALARLAETLAEAIR
jgi:hypothetical protein